MAARKKLPATDSDLYRFHVANLRSIEMALDQLALGSKDLIRKKRDYLVEPFLRTWLLIFGAWTECRLRKVLYEKSGFTSAERDQVQKARKQEQKWKITIETGFRHRYKVKKLTVNSLGHSAYSKYDSLIKAFEQYVKPVIELRNKLAHGQWVYPLTNDETAIAQEAMEQIKRENLLSANFKRQMITHISALVHDLVASSSFDRDFDSNYRRFQQVILNLEKEDYQRWADKLRISYEKSKRSRNPA